VRAGLLFLPLLLSAAPASPPLVQVEVKDVVPLKELNQHAVVLVSKEDGTVLPLFVDETAAVAIAFRLMGRPSWTASSPASEDGSPRSGSTG
jgi:hypothetical protein